MEMTNIHPKRDKLMKAIRIHSYGGPEVLEFEDVQVPAPGPGQVLVDVAVAGMNFMDTGTRRGYPSGLHTVPMTPGVEGAGTVAAVGPGVTHVRVGDRVAWYFVWGSHAQQLIAPAEALVPLPADIDFDTAASVMMQGLTALYLMRDTHKLEAGQTALVHSAAGGVGLLLTQMSKIKGARVIGRVSSPEKVAAAKEAGADEVIVSKTGRFKEQVLALTQGRGVDVVYDGSGGETFHDSVHSLGYFGTLALFGPLMDPIPPIDVFKLPNSIKLTYPMVMHAIRDHERLVRYSNQLFEWLRTGQLKVRIGHRYPLSEARQAHIDIESRATTGKLLLQP